MKRGDLMRYISEMYGADAEYPWVKYPDYAVFRHKSNNKWFALIMSVPYDKLGLTGTGLTDIVNVKCGPLLAGSLLSERGIYEAYHMNKANWVSAALDGSVDGDKIKALIDMSFNLTLPKSKNK
ncbi:MAG: MmcQ/YjbR family DNA-binding protein [Firmicutes bacterium]|nr:MmcQ/YjbR family DNA-binding protein [Bacillota bacterium]